MRVVFPKLLLLKKNKHPVKPYIWKVTNNLEYIGMKLIWHPLLLEQFLIKCPKTKTKVITLANHKGHWESNEPIKTRKARENVRGRVTIGCGFTSDWMKEWREIFKPII